MCNLNYQDFSGGEDSTRSGSKSMTFSVHSNTCLPLEASVPEQCAEPRRDRSSHLERSRWTTTGPAKALAPTVSGHVYICIRTDPPAKPMRLYRRFNNYVDLHHSSARHSVESAVTLDSEQTASWYKPERLSPSTSRWSTKESMLASTACTCGSQICA